MFKIKSRFLCFLISFGLVNCVEKYSSKYVNLDDYIISLSGSASSLISTLSKKSKFKCFKACNDRSDCKLALVNKESSSCQLYSVQADFESKLSQPESYFTKQQTPNGNQKIFYTRYFISEGNTFLSTESSVTTSVILTSAQESTIFFSTESANSSQTSDPPGTNTTTSSLFTELNQTNVTTSEIITTAQESNSSTILFLTDSVNSSQASDPALKNTTSSLFTESTESSMSTSGILTSVQESSVSTILFSAESANITEATDPTETNKTNISFTESTESSMSTSGILTSAQESTILFSTESANISQASDLALTNTTTSSLFTELNETNVTTSGILTSAKESNSSTILFLTESANSSQVTDPTETNATTSISYTESTESSVTTSGIQNYPRTCQDISGVVINGEYTIYPDGYPLLVYCEMTKGGWTRIMNKIDRLPSFNKNWDEYKNGFGDLNGNYWIGLENMRKILNNNSMSLRLEGFVSSVSIDFIVYSNFSVDTEANGYQLTLGTKIGGGTLTDHSAYHNGMKFTTFDKDNDLNPSANLASSNLGGWWFRDAAKMCPTCQYIPYSSPSPFITFKNITLMIKS